MKPREHHLPKVMGQDAVRKKNKIKFFSSIIVKKVQFHVWFIMWFVIMLMGVKWQNWTHLNQQVLWFHLIYNIHRLFTCVLKASNIMADRMREDRALLYYLVLLDLKIAQMKWCVEECRVTNTQSVMLLALVCLMHFYTHFTCCFEVKMFPVYLSFLMNILNYIRVDGWWWGIIIAVLVHTELLCYRQ